MSKTAKKHKEAAPKQLGFAVVSVSTSRYKDSEAGKHISDESGDLIIEALRRNGHKIVSRGLVSDDKGMIKQTIQEMLKSPRIDAIVTSGGTGINPSDVTIETVRPLLEKELPGFGEIFRQLSYVEIGSAAVMTRAMAGVAKGKVIFCLPGSPNAVDICLGRLILPEAGHIILHARGK